MSQQKISQQTEDRSKKKSIWSYIHRRGSSSSSSSSSSSQQYDILPTTTNLPQSSELNQHLKLDSDIDCEEENFKVLERWQKRQGKFSVLSQLARDILIIPVSTVSSESAFSTNGRILDDRKTSLNPEIVEIRNPRNHCYLESVNDETISFRAVMRDVLGFSERMVLLGILSLAK
ncbi:HAT, C-terminal dimerization domain containing protein [Parasponia andersonii]|uniref:HAT, C-terminal dimerization domain containing protein n=1 Tax=Parasponia andersonii TaxID=3476 RepID=A0A2P5BBR3_PARAD|nr:HAT, C-terminal dimerization domain containing protein [Parasponia andersonii]